MIPLTRVEHLIDNRDGAEVGLVDGDNTLTLTAEVSGSELKAVYTASTE